MPPKKKQTKGRFQPQGEHSKEINRWLLTQAQKSVDNGGSALEGDFAWVTFKDKNSVLVDKIASDHPGPDDDSTKLVRSNFAKQVERFKKWLVEATGYPDTFAAEVGLINSGLGGSCGTNQQPGNDDEEASVDSDVPLADSDKKPAAKKAPPRKKTVEESLDDLTDNLRTFDIDTSSEMQIKTFYLKDVEVRPGASIVRSMDVLGVQVRVTTGTILSTMEIAPVREDPNMVRVSAELHPALSNGAYRTKPAWFHHAGAFALRIQEALSTSCLEDVVPGVTPPHERDEDTFRWPEGLRSAVNPIDPYTIKLRNAALGQADSPYEIEEVMLPDSCVPCFLITAFFPIEQSRHVRGAGVGLKLPVRPTAQAAGAATGNNKRGRAESPKGDAKMAGVGGLGGVFNILTFGLFAMTNK